jgi:hypothetical protein
MEFAQKEVQLIADVVASLDAEVVQELSDAQLAIIGGGSGEVTPF